MMKIGKFFPVLMSYNMGFSFRTTFLFWADIRHLQLVHFLGQLIAVLIG